MNSVTCQASAWRQIGAVAAGAVPAWATAARLPSWGHHSSIAASGSTSIASNPPAQPRPRPLASGYTLADAIAAATPMLSA